MGGLGNGIDQDGIGKDRVFWEVALEYRFVDTDVFNPNDALS